MKLGIKLLSYKGQEFDLWVYENSIRCKADTREELESTLQAYRHRNPWGNYTIMPIEE